MDEKALVEAIANKPTHQVAKMPGTLNGLTIVTVSPLVSGRTYFIHKVVGVESSNLLNLKKDLIAKIDGEEQRSSNS